MAVTLRKIRNPQARPLVLAGHGRCMHWAGCGDRATHVVPMFMGSVNVCARHAD